MSYNGGRESAMKKILIIAAFAAVAALAYGPAKDAIARARGVSVAGGVLTCDYNGRSYAKGAQRKAEDDCNVCTCGNRGWACTRIFCAPGGDGAGTISGALSAPDGGKLPAERVCALNLKTDKEYCQQTVAGETTYAIPVPVGEYWVYAALAGSDGSKKAYYAQQALCGAGEDCRDHTPVTVKVAASEIAEADPRDWAFDGRIDTLNVTPSKWEYNTHNYYPTSKFVLKGAGLASVEMFATPYPPLEGAPASSLGQSTLSTDERGIQTWLMPIANGFQATDVYAVGTTASGSYMKSRTLRIVRPIETDSASSTIRNDASR